MSRITIISVALLIAAGYVVSADGQETQIGNGRLLKKFRDDVFGAPSQQKGTQNKTPQQPTPAQMQSRQGQPQPNQPANPQANPNQNRSSGLFRAPQFSKPSAQPSQQQQPIQRQAQQQTQQSAQQRQNTRQPHPQNQQQFQSSSRNTNGSINRNDPRYRGQAQATPRTQGQPAANPNQPNQTPQTQAQLDYYRRKGSPSNLTSPRNLASQQPQQQAPSPLPSQTFEPQPVNPQYSQPQLPESRTVDKAATLAKAKRRGPQSAGFGLELNIDKEEQIYVSDVERLGNAAKAGLKKGDLILEIGGAKLASVEEFDEIAKVMKDGDQLELKISRRGRTSVVPLQFGEAPELPENSAPQATDIAGSQAPHIQNQPNDFVPSSDNTGSETLNSGVEDVPAPPVSIDRPELPEIDLEIDTPNSVLDLESFDRS